MVAERLSVCLVIGKLRARFSLEVTLLLHSAMGFMNREWGWRWRVTGDNYRSNSLFIFKYVDI